MISHRRTDRPSIEPLEARRFLSAARTAFDAALQSAMPPAAPRPHARPAAVAGLLRRTAQLSTARWAASATAVGDLAIFAGGLADHANGRGSRVDVFNVATSHWTAHNLPGLYHPSGAISVDGKVLFAGSDALMSHNVVDLYDPATGSLSAVTLGAYRSGVAATVVGGRAIFAGGRSSSGEPSNTADVYDAASGQWFTMTLPVERGSTPAFATSVCGRAIFTDGNTADIYDSSTGLWSATTLPTAQQVTAAITVGTTVFIGGGYGLDIYTEGMDLYIYDTITGLWSTTPPPHGSIGRSIAVAGNIVLFAYTARYDEVAQRFVYDLIDIFDSANDTWSTTTLPHADFVPWDVLTATSLGDKAAFVHGTTTGNVAYVDLYDPATGAWTSVARPARNANPLAVAVGEQLIIADRSSLISTAPVTVSILTPTNVPPPANPSLMSGAVLAAPPSLLEWSASPGAESYDVYLDGTLVQNVPGNQWLPVTAIAAGAHDWRVAARFGAGSLSGPTWHFDLLPTRA